MSAAERGPLPIHMLGCSCAAHVFPEVRKALFEEDATVTHVMIAEAFLLDLTPSEGRARHERIHDEQKASFAPEWAKWLPITVRAWLGIGAFWKAYMSEHHQHSYLGNQFEVAARRAEDPTVFAVITGAAHDEKTPPHGTTKPKPR